MRQEASHKRGTARIRKGTGTMKTTITRPSRRKALAAVIVAIVMSLGIATSPASAWAYGTSGWGWVSYNGKGLSKGVYHVELGGGGTYVSYVRGWPQLTTPVSGSICNWSITAEFFNSAGQWYRTYTSPTRWGCNWYGSLEDQRININGGFQRGKMCSTLRENGARLTSVCHNIY